MLSFKYIPEIYCDLISRYHLSFDLTVHPLSDHTKDIFSPFYGWGHVERSQYVPFHIRRAFHFIHWQNWNLMRRYQGIQIYCNIYVCSSFLLHYVPWKIWPWYPAVEWHPIRISSFCRFQQLRLEQIEAVPTTNIQWTNDNTWWKLFVTRLSCLEEWINQCIFSATTLRIC